jgi:heme A synthase
MIEFILAFLCTLVAFLAVLWTGLRWRIKRRRALHLSLVGLTVALLVWTIAAALQLGKGYDLETAGAIYPVHMLLAKLATLSLLAPVATGVVTLRTGESHRHHRTGAFSAFVLIVLSAITGIWMILVASPI